MRKIKITLQIEKEGFILRELIPVSNKNKLLMNLKEKGEKNG